MVVNLTICFTRIPVKLMDSSMNPQEICMLFPKCIFLINKISKN